MSQPNKIHYDSTVEVTNRFKGLVLVDRVPEELWMGVHNIVQEVVTKIIHRKRKCKRQSGCLRRPYRYLKKVEKLKAKKERKDRYIHLNAEFQRMVRRDKKAFLREKCKEIEENHRTGKTKDVFKKIRDTKGIFHAKTGTIKD